MLTVASAEDVAALLRTAGHAVVAYTGRTEAAARELIEADLLGNRVNEDSAGDAWMVGVSVCRLTGGNVSARVGS